MNELQQAMLGQLGSHYSSMGNAIPTYVAADKRPIRVKLEELLSHKNNIIKRVSEEIEEINKLIVLLNEHPHLERFNDLVNRILDDPK